MYASINFRTKRAFRDAIKAGEYVTVWQPGPFSQVPQASPQYTGTVAVEGPHYPAPHTWYATVKVECGRVVSVK